MEFPLLWKLIRKFKLSWIDDTFLTYTEIQTFKRKRHKNIIKAVIQPIKHYYVQIWDISTVAYLRL